VPQVGTRGPTWVATVPQVGTRGRCAADPGIAR